jgi:hypothetical protein
MPQGQQLGGVPLDRWFEKAIKHVISGSPENLPVQTRL